MARLDKHPKGHPVDRHVAAPTRRRSQRETGRDLLDMYVRVGLVVSYDQVSGSRGKRKAKRGWSVLLVGAPGPVLVSDSDLEAFLGEFWPDQKSIPTREAPQGPDRR